MDAIRRRFGSLLEWLCAAACAAGGALLLSVAVGSVRHVPAVVPVIAKEASELMPGTGIPPGVAQVPFLLLADDREVRIGDRLDAVVRRLGPTAQLASELREAVGSGIRATQVYTDVGVQFILVLDAPSRDQALRVSAIFLR